MNSKSSVAIIGCGWLGQALATHLLAKNYQVVGTSQSSDTLNKISVLGATAEQLVLPLAENDDKPYQCFNCDFLVIAIPPQLRYGNTGYAERISQIVERAKKGKVKQLILINSTAIYGGLSGDVNEDAVLDLSQPKVKVLQQAEAFVLDSDLQAVSLRVAGLVGPNRLPGNFFKQGRQLKEPCAYVNLIHQIDIVAIIANVIAAEKVEGIYNVSSDMKMSKQAFYQQAALSLGNPQPQFKIDTSNSTGKFIVSKKVREVLSYQFKYDNLLTWLTERQVSQR